MIFMRAKKGKEGLILLKLSFPILFAQLAQTGITLFETIFAGHYADEGISLAGVAIGVSIWLPAVLFAQGILSILTPISAQLNGAAKQHEIKNQIRQGLIIAAVLSGLLMIFLFHADKIILLRSTEAHPIDPKMVAMASDFLKIMSFGAPGLLFYLVYRFQCEGLSDTKPIMIVMLVAFLINIPLNYAFINGKWGAPELGGIGCGVTGAIVFWLMFILIKCYVTFSKRHQCIRAVKLKHWIDFSAIKTIFKLGLPLGFAYFFEVTLFAVIALLIAPLGATVVSAHQIIFQISSLTFVVPLALGIASSIRTGYLLGKQDYLMAQFSARLTLCIGAALSVVLALCLLMFKLPLIHLFTNEASIVIQASALTFLLASYQIFDYLQVILSNVLRAYEDTKSIFLITFSAYWIIGLPIGYVLGLTPLVRAPLGVAGFWIGINAGLGAAALMMFMRLILIQKRILLK